LAQPSALEELEGALVLVAKQRSRFMAPVAPHDVRVSESRIGTEDGHSDCSLVADEVIAAHDLSCGLSNDLSRHERQHTLLFTGNST
jgi:hypothetical protein